MVHLATLVEQYRMRPDVQRFPNKMYYGSLLVCRLKVVPLAPFYFPWPNSTVDVDDNLRQ